MRRLGRVGAALHEALRNFHRNRGGDLAATVSFYAVVSLAPALYLAGKAIDGLLRREGGLDAVASRLAQFTPALARSAVEAAIADAPAPAGFLLLAVPGLIWVATSALSSLEYAVNVAFSAEGKRGIWRSRGKALGLLGAGVLALSVSLILQTVWPRVALLTRGLRNADDLTAWLSYLATLAVAYLTFLAFYKFLPRRRVGWRSAALGGVAALVLWEGARRVFTLVLWNSPSFGLLNGALASTVALLLWLYASVAVILFGAEFTALMNRERVDGLGPASKAPRTG